MSIMRDITVFIYEEEVTNISRWTLQYPNVETGGNLFGLWRSETEVVIQLAIGPGAKCRRTATSFFQDKQYLGDVGTYLISTKGLCNIGEWHSRHSLDLPKPSSDDRQTIWRDMPRHELKRFLLLIATVKSGVANTHSFMFTLPEDASRSGEMFPTKFQILPEPNPFRIQSEVQQRLNIGAEMVVGSSSREFRDSRKQIMKEERERKKMVKKNRIRDKKEKKKNKKEMRKKEKDERAENETAKECEEKRKGGSGKRKRWWPSRSKKIDGNNYLELHDKKGMDVSSRTANDQENNQPRIESRKVDINWQNTDGCRSASEQDLEQTRSQMASSGNTRSSKPLLEDQQKGNKESKIVERLWPSYSHSKLGMGALSRTAYNGVLNTNLSNGPDANLSTQHVPESQYGLSNDKNTSNFDNGSGTEKIEEKEDDKAEDMISNNLQTQTDTINGGLEEVKVKVNDGTNDGNTNLSDGLHANLSTQHVPESQYGSSNDQNTSNFDNGSGTEKIEGKEDDKAEDMISNDVQAQSEMIDGTQTRQTSDFQENPQDECPNKDDEDDEDRETSETHRGPGTEQEPRDVNCGTSQKSKPNGMETEVETPDCPSERNSVPQSTDDDEKIGTTSNGISSPCDDAKDASKDVAIHECQPKDETDKQTTETQKGFESEQEPRDVNSGTRQKSKPNGMETEVETPDCPSERTSVPQSTDDDEKIGTTSNGISSRCDDAKDVSKDVVRNECQPKDETDKQTAETQKGFETRRSAPNINHGTDEPKLTSTEVRAKPMEENILGQSLKKDQRSESAKLDGLAAAHNSGETHSDGKDHDDSTVSSYEVEGDQSNDPNIDNSLDQTCSNPSNNNARSTSTLSQTNGQPNIVNEEHDKLAKKIITKIKSVILLDCKNVGCRYVYITLEFQSTVYQLTCDKRIGDTLSRTTVTLNVGHEQLVETEMNDSIEEIAEFAAENIFQHQQACRS